MAFCHGNSLPGSRSAKSNNARQQQQSQAILSSQNSQQAVQGAVSRLPHNLARSLVNQDILPACVAKNYL